MSKRITMKQLEALQKEGKLKGFKVLQEKPTELNRKVSAASRSRSKEKDWISFNLQYWCNQQAVGLEHEYQFNPNRKWRLDWAIPSLMIAIEYEGVMSEKSRHTQAVGYTNDTNKYNCAQSRGWRVLRFTALNYKSLITELNKIISHVK
ncbi:MAG: hypothetical protein KAF40_00325 [Flavihumibacter sp.]|nr:hypothetical protein [Flavihumibacter sp.]